MKKILLLSAESQMFYQKGSNIGLIENGKTVYYKILQMKCVDVGEYDDTYELDVEPIINSNIDSIQNEINVLIKNNSITENKIAKLKNLLEKELMK